LRPYPSGGGSYVTDKSASGMVVVVRLRCFMKPLRLLLFLLALPLLGLSEQRDRLIIEENTPVRVRLNWNLSWANARVGDRVPLEVVQDVVVKSRADGKNYLVIERGEMAVGTVTDIERGRHKGRNDMGVTLGCVMLADGERIALHPNGQEPYFLRMNAKDRTMYPAGTERTAFTYREVNDGGNWGRVEHRFWRAGSHVTRSVDGSLHEGIRGPFSWRVSATITAQKDCPSRRLCRWLPFADRAGSAFSSAAGPLPTAAYGFTHRAV
jgi:hypothetical protein